MLIDFINSALSEVLVNSLKAVTSRRLRNEFLDLRVLTANPLLSHALTLGLAAVRR